MRYYIYFDGYGHLRHAIDEKELAEKYDNDPDEFLRAMRSLGPSAMVEQATGHVSTLVFRDEGELNDYLESLSDEITGFYECRSESRPYNFR
jgi:hypothetical protein